MMSKLSLIDKLKVLADVTSSSGLFIVAIIFLIILAYLLVTINTKTKKINKISFIIIYSLIFIFSLVFYKKELFSLFDYMMNNFFILIYFPNLAIYFCFIIITNIILWVSIFNKKITNLLRNINTTIFCFIHYILILIINIITKNKLDIFKPELIYKNKEAQALIELSSVVFVVWILFLIVYKIIRMYQENQNISINTSLNKTTTDRNNTPQYITKKEIIYKNKLPENIKKTNAPNIIYGKISKKEEKFENKHNVEDNNSYLNNIPGFTFQTENQELDTMLQKTKETKNIAKELKKSKLDTKDKIQESKKSNELDIFNNLLTIDDYKRVLSILKTYQSKQQEDKNKINCDNLSELYKIK